jgi:hypothetical protein
MSNKSKAKRPRREKATRASSANQVDLTPSDNEVEDEDEPYIPQHLEPEPVKPGEPRWQWPFHWSKEVYAKPTAEEINYRQHEGFTIMYHKGRVFFVKEEPPDIPEDEEPEFCGPLHPRWQWPFHWHKDDYSPPTTVERERKIAQGYRVFLSSEYYNEQRWFYHKSIYLKYPRPPSDAQGPPPAGGAGACEAEVQSADLPPVKPTRGLVEMAQDQPPPEDLLTELESRFKNPDVTVGTLCDFPISWKDVQKLATGRWLSGDLIDAVLKWWNATTSVPQGSNPRCYYMNTHFWTKLTRRNNDEVSGYYYEGVEKWTRRVDLFSFDVVFIPLNENKVHWCLAIVDVRNKYTVFLDSMDSSQRRPDVHELLHRYLADEHKSKLKRELARGEWRVHQMPSESVPQQDNHSDCGVFTLLFATYYSIDQPFTFAQRDMDPVRRFLTNVIYQAGVKKGGA